MTSLQQFSKPTCVESRTSSFSTESSYNLFSSTGCSSVRRMGLYSTSENKEENFLPSLAANNGSASKHDAKRGKKTKGSRSKKQKDAFVRFPELATDNDLTRNSTKTLARKSSSPTVNFQTQEMLKNRKNEATKFTTQEKRRGNLHLPSLALTATEESVTRKATESWSAALGLRDSYEIPLSVFNKMKNDILKIDRQLREEAKLQEIRERRIISMEWKDATELYSSGNTFGRTSLSKFSYFPCLQTKTASDSSEFMPPRWAKEKRSERMLRQEGEIERKMREFKHRHSISKYKNVK